MSVDELIREGRLLFDGGKVPDAIARWQQVLLREPANREAQDLIRGARGAQRAVPGERTQTLRAFTEGMQDSEMSRRLAEEKLKHGMLLLKQARTAEAIESLQAAHDLDPTRDEISRVLSRAKEQYVLDEKVEEIYQQGVSNLQSGQFMEAVTKFLRVLAVDEKHPRAKSSLEQAKAAMAPSSEAGPASAGMASGAGAKERAKELFRLGVEAYKRDNLEDAVELWQEVVELDPQHPRASKYREKALATLAKKATSAPPPPVRQQPAPVPEPELEFAGSTFFDDPVPQLHDLPGVARRAEESIVWDVPAEAPPTRSPRPPAAPADPFDLRTASRDSLDFAPAASSSAGGNPFELGAPLAEGDGFEFGPPPGESADAFEFGPPPGEAQEAFLFDTPAGIAFPGGNSSTDPFAFGSKPPPPPPPARSAQPAAKAHTPFDDFLPPAPPAQARKDPFAATESDPDLAFGSFTPDAAVEDIFGTSGGPKPGAISTTAADFLDEVRAAPAHSTAPPPAWISGEPPLDDQLPSSPIVTGADAMLEEGRRSMAEERYEEAIHTFKKALAGFPEHPDIRFLLERGVNCLSAREQLASSLAQAEQAAATGDWEVAARHASRVLQLNPYLRRAQKIATEAHSLTPARSGASADGSSRSAPAGTPVINPFAVKKTGNPLLQQGPASGPPRRWPLFAAIALILGGVGYFGWQRWEQLSVEQAKERLADEALQRQKLDAAAKAAEAEEALKAANLVLARDLFTKASSLDPQEKRFKTRLQETQAVLDQQVQPMVALAQQFIERSHYDKAIEQAQLALEIDPANPTAVSIKTTAIHYRDTSGSSEEKIFRISNFQKFIDRGDEAFDRRDYTVARDFYQIAFDLSPRNDLAQSKLAKAEGRLSEMRLVRTREAAILEEAMALAEARKFKAAFEKVQSVLEAVPDSARAKQALEKINVAIERQKNLELYKKLALQYYHLGKEGQALEFFKKWYELEPDSRDAKFYIDQLKGSGN